MVMADDEDSDFVANAAEQKALSRKWSSVVRGWGDQLLGDTDLRLAFKPLSDMVGAARGAARSISSPANGGI
jgi:hypothetical protein